MTQELSNAIENTIINFGALDELLELMQSMFEVKTTVPMVTPNSNPEAFKEANDALEAWQNMTRILPAISVFQNKLREQLGELELAE